MIGAGLVRDAIRCENVVERHPPRNQMSEIPTHELEYWVDKLHGRLSDLHDPYVLVPVGNTALKALLGTLTLDKASKQRLSITAARGFVFEYTDRRGRKLKVIPSIHPAAVFQTARYAKPIENDWRKIAHESHFREIRTDPWSIENAKHYTSLTVRDLRSLVAEAKAKAKLLTFDIETTDKPEHRIQCIGFSWDPTWSFVVPIDDPRGWSSKRDHDAAIELVRELLTSAVPKVTQNGWYDVWWLAIKYGIWPAAWLYDLKPMHTVLDARDVHTLNYMASMYGTVRYWKDEAKNPDKSRMYGNNYAALMTYCGADCTAQRYLGERLIEELRTENKLHVFENFYRPAYQTGVEMAVRGFRVDSERMATEHKAAMIRLKEIDTEFEGLAGKQMVMKGGGLSSAKVIEYLYKDLKLPEQKNRKSKRLTGDKTALMKLAQKTNRSIDPPRAARSLDLIMERRKIAKQTEFLDTVRVSPYTGRFHSSYDPCSNTGRYKSESDPMDFGGNGQNIDHRIRYLFKPNEGQVLLAGDASQVEDRTAKMRTRDPALIELARKKPWEYDAHNHSASMVFGGTLEEFTARYNSVDEAVRKEAKRQRDLAKAVVHGAWRGLGGTKLAETLLVKGFGTIPVKECNKMLDSFIERMTALPRWQMEVRRQLMLTGKLSTWWGLEIDFGYDRLDDETFRKGYSFQPQADAVGILNLQGLFPLRRLIRNGGLLSSILAQVHDEIVISADPEEAYDLAVFLQRNFERPVLIEGEPLSVPMTFKLGSSWKCEFEFKQFPSREEFNDCLKEVQSNANAIAA